MPVGGDITEITCNHPTLGMKSFSPKAAEDSTYNLGGFRASDDANNLAGNGKPITALNRVMWSFAVAIAWGMNSPNEQELEALVAMAGSPEEGTWTFTNVNGVIYSGLGRPLGDLEGNGNSSTIDLKVGGGGVLKIQ